MRLEKHRDCDQSHVQDQPLNRFPCQTNEAVGIIRILV